LAGYLEVLQRIEALLNQIANDDTFYAVLGVRGLALLNAARLFIRYPIVCEAATECNLWAKDILEKLFDEKEVSDWLNYTYITPCNHAPS